MREYVLTLLGKRGSQDRVSTYHYSLTAAISYLEDINWQRRQSGLGPARCSLVSRPAWFI